MDKKNKTIDLNLHLLISAELTASSTKYFIIHDFTYNSPPSITPNVASKQKLLFQRNILEIIQTHCLKSTYDTKEYYSVFFVNAEMYDYIMHNTVVFAKTYHWKEVSNSDDEIVFNVRNEKHLRFVVGIISEKRTVSISDGGSLQKRIVKYVQTSENTRINLPVDIMNEIKDLLQQQQLDHKDSLSITEAAADAAAAAAAAATNSTEAAAATTKDNTEEEEDSTTNFVMHDWWKVRIEKYFATKNTKRGHLLFLPWRRLYVWEWAYLQKSALFEKFQDDGNIDQLQLDHDYYLKKKSLQQVLATEAVLKIHGSDMYYLVSFARSAVNNSHYGCFVFSRKSYQMFLILNAKNENAVFVSHRRYQEEEAAVNHDGRQIFFEVLAKKLHVYLCEVKKVVVGGHKFGCDLCLQFAEFLFEKYPSLFFNCFFLGTLPSGRALLREKSNLLYPEICEAHNVMLFVKGQWVSSSTAWVERFFCEGGETSRSGGGNGGGGTRHFPRVILLHENDVMLSRFLDLGSIPERKVVFQCRRQNKKKIEGGAGVLKGMQRGMRNVLASVPFMDVKPADVADNRAYYDVLTSSAQETEQLRTAATAVATGAAATAAGAAAAAAAEQGDDVSNPMMMLGPTAGATTAATTTTTSRAEIMKLYVKKEEASGDKKPDVTLYPLEQYKEWTCVEYCTNIMHMVGGGVYFVPDKVEVTFGLSDGIEAKKKSLLERIGVSSSKKDARNYDVNGSYLLLDGGGGGGGGGNAVEIDFKVKRADTDVMEAVAAAAAAAATDNSTMAKPQSSLLLLLEREYLLKTELLETCEYYKQSYLRRFTNDTATAMSSSERLSLQVVPILWNEELVPEKDRKETAKKKGWIFGGTVVGGGDDSEEDDGANKVLENTKPEELHDNKVRIYYKSTDTLMVVLELGSDPIDVLNNNNNLPMKKLLHKKTINWMKWAWPKVLVSVGTTDPEVWLCDMESRHIAPQCFGEKITSAEFTFYEDNLVLVREGSNNLEVRSTESPYIRRLHCEVKCYTGKLVKVYNNHLMLSGNLFIFVMDEIEGRNHYSTHIGNFGEGQTEMKIQHILDDDIDEICFAHNELYDICLIKWKNNNEITFLVYNKKKSKYTKIEQKIQQQLKKCKMNMDEKNICFVDYTNDKGLGLMVIFIDEDDNININCNVLTRPFSGSIDNYVFGENIDCVTVVTSSKNSSPPSLTCMKYMLSYDSFFDWLQTLNCGQSFLEHFLKQGQIVETSEDYPNDFEYVQKVNINDEYFKTLNSDDIDMEVRKVLYWLMNYDNTTKSIPTLLSMLLNLQEGSTSNNDIKLKRFLNKIMDLKYQLFVDMTIGKELYSKPEYEALMYQICFIPNHNKDKMELLQEWSKLDNLSESGKSVITKLFDTFNGQGSAVDIKDVFEKAFQYKMRESGGDITLTPIPVSKTSIVNDASLHHLVDVDVSRKRIEDRNRNLRRMKKGGDRKITELNLLMSKNFIATDNENDDDGEIAEDSDVEIIHDEDDVDNEKDNEKDKDTNVDETDDSLNRRQLVVTEDITYLAADQECQELSLTIRPIDALSFCTCAPKSTLYATRDDIKRNFMDSVGLHHKELGFVTSLAKSDVQLKDKDTARSNKNVRRKVATDPAQRLRNLKEIIQTYSNANKNTNYFHRFLNSSSGDDDDEFYMTEGASFVQTFVSTYVANKTRSFRFE